MLLRSSLLSPQPTSASPSGVSRKRPHLDHSPTATLVTASPVPEPVELPSKQRLRAQRSKRRIAAAQGVGSSVILKQAAVRCQGTRDKYLLHRTRFDNHCAAEAVQPRTEPQFDKGTTSLLGELYLDGEPLASGNYLIAALCFFPLSCQSGVVVTCRWLGRLSEDGETWCLLSLDCRCLGQWWH